MKFCMVILGARFFVLYINDIRNMSSLMKFILFVANTNIYCGGNNLCDTLNRELAKLFRLFVVYKLLLNLAEKRTIGSVLFRYCPPEVDINVCLNNEKIITVRVIICFELVLVESGSDHLQSKLFN